MSGPALAIGIGCNSGASTEAVIELVQQALSQAEGQACGLYTMEEKRRVAALQEAAAQLDLPLVYLTLDELKAVAPRALTQSPVVYALYGVPSIAETAALVGAGPQSELLFARLSAGGVTCAIASSKDKS